MGRSKTKHLGTAASMSATPAIIEDKPAKARQKVLILIKNKAPIGNLKQLQELINLLNPDDLAPLLAQALQYKATDGIAQALYDRMEEIHDAYVLEKLSLLTLLLIYADDTDSKALRREILNRLTKPSQPFDVGMSGVLLSTVDKIPLLALVINRGDIPLIEALFYALRQSLDSNKDPLRSFSTEVIESMLKKLDELNIISAIDILSQFFQGDLNKLPARCLLSHMIGLPSLLQHPNLHVKLAGLELPLLFQATIACQYHKWPTDLLNSLLYQRCKDQGISLKEVREEGLRILLEEHRGVEMLTNWVNDCLAHFEGGYPVEETLFIKACAITQDVPTYHLLLQKVDPKKLYSIIHKIFSDIFTPGISSARHSQYVQSMRQLLIYCLNFSDHDVFLSLDKGVITDLLMILFSVKIPTECYFRCDSAFETQIIPTLCRYALEPCCGPIAERYPELRRALLLDIGFTYFKPTLAVGVLETMFERAPSTVASWLPSIKHRDAAIPFLCGKPAAFGLFFSASKSSIIQSRYFPGVLKKGPLFSSMAPFGLDVGSSPDQSSTLREHYAELRRGSTDTSLQIRYAMLELISQLRWNWSPTSLRESPTSEAALLIAYPYLPYYLQKWVNHERLNLPKVAVPKPNDVTRESTVFCLYHVTIQLGKLQKQTTDRTGYTLACLDDLRVLLPTLLEKNWVDIYLRFKELFYHNDEALFNDTERTAKENPHTFLQFMLYCPAFSDFARFKDLLENPANVGWFSTSKQYYHGFEIPPVEVMLFELTVICSIRILKRSSVILLQCLKILADHQFPFTITHRDNLLFNCGEIIANIDAEEGFTDTQKRVAKLCLANLIFKISNDTGSLLFNVDPSIKEFLDRNGLDEVEKHKRLRERRTIFVEDHRPSLRHFTQLGFSPSEIVDQLSDHFPQTVAYCRVLYDYFSQIEWGDQDIDDACAHEFPNSNPCRDLAALAILEKRPDLMFKCSLHNITVLFLNYVNYSSQKLLSEIVVYIQQILRHQEDVYLVVLNLRDTLEAFLQQIDHINNQKLLNLCYFLSVIILFLEENSSTTVAKSTAALYRNYLALFYNQFKLREINPLDFYLRNRFNDEIVIKILQLQQGQVLLTPMHVEPLCELAISSRNAPLLCIAYGVEENKAWFEKHALSARPFIEELFEAINGEENPASLVIQKKCDSLRMLFELEPIRPLCLAWLDANEPKVLAKLLGFMVKPGSLRDGIVKLMQEKCASSEKLDCARIVAITSQYAGKEFRQINWPEGRLRSAAKVLDSLGGRDLDEVACHEKRAISEFNERMQEIKTAYAAWETSKPGNTISPSVCDGLEKIIQDLNNLKLGSIVLHDKAKITSQKEDFLAEMYTQLKVIRSQLQQRAPKENELPMPLIVETRVKPSKPTDSKKLPEMPNMLLPSATAKATPPKESENHALTAEAKRRADEAEKARRAAQAQREQNARLAALARALQTVAHKPKAPDTAAEPEAPNTAAEPKAPNTAAEPKVRNPAVEPELSRQHDGVDDSSARLSEAKALLEQARVLASVTVRNRERAESAARLAALARREAARYRWQAEKERLKAEQAQFQIAQMYCAPRFFAPPQVPLQVRCVGQTFGNQGSKEQIVVCQDGSLGLLTQAGVDANFFRQIIKPGTDTSKPFSIGKSSNNNMIMGLAGVGRIEVTKISSQEARQAELIGVTEYGQCQVKLLRDCQCIVIGSSLDGAEVFVLMGQHNSPLVTIGNADDVPEEGASAASYRNA